MKYLYHGTIASAAENIITNGIDLQKSRNYLDFGKGFYLTENKGTATKWANRLALFNDESPIVLKFTANFNNLSWHTFKLNGEWQEEIWQQRVMGNDHFEYDVLIGPIADNAINDFSKAARAGKINKSIFIQNIAPNMASKQYVFKTLNGINQLEFRGKE